MELVMMDDSKVNCGYNALVKTGLKIHYDQISSKGHAIHYLKSGLRLTIMPIIKNSFIECPL